MKKIKIITGVFAIAATLFISCSEGLEDINENPNAPEFVLPNTIFNSATKQYTDFLRDGFNSGRVSLPWMQYWGQNAYADEDRYLYRETSAESLYRNTYLVATEFKSIIDINTNPETMAEASAVGDNNNQIAASRIMLAFLFHKLTDFFGDVPYYSYGTQDTDFQALDIDNILSPKFATQAKIYADILKELREAADMINTSAPVFTSGDNIYNGDAVKWKKFANSLILRVANRLKSVDSGTANSAISAAISSGVFTSNEDNASQNYEANNTNGSPVWLAFLTRSDFAPTKTFVDVLKGDLANFGPDPRLFEMVAPKLADIEHIKIDDYEESTDYDDYVGIPYAFPLANTLPFTSYSFGSSKVIRPDYREVLMEYAEVSFILSEMNGWNQVEYENGVRASMQKWGVPSVDVEAFVAALPAASQETVLNQKYIALYMQGEEAWSEYRRTGFPNFLVLPGDEVILPAEQATASGVTSYVFTPGPDASDLPFRLRYPQYLQTLNGANRAEAVARLSDGDTIFSKLFWDVN